MWYVHISGICAISSLCGRSMNILLHHRSATAWLCVPTCVLCASWRLSSRYGVCFDICFDLRLFWQQVTASSTPEIVEPVPCMQYFFRAGGLCWKEQCLLLRLVQEQGSTTNVATRALTAHIEGSGVCACNDYAPGWRRRVYMCLHMSEHCSMSVGLGLGRGRALHEPALRIAESLHFHHGSLRIDADQAAVISA